MFILVLCPFKEVILGGWLLLNGVRPYVDWLSAAYGVRGLHTLSPTQQVALSCVDGFPCCAEAFTFHVAPPVYFCLVAFVLGGKSKT